MFVPHRRRQPGGERHLQVPLEAEQRRNQDEDLSNVLERSPMLRVTHTDTDKSKDLRIIL